MGEYLSALLDHWVTLMSGVVSLIVGMGLRVTRRVADLRNLSEIPDWLFIGIGVVCLLLAGYKTWSDEHKQLLSERDANKKLSGQLEELSQPKLDGTIEQVMSGTARPYNKFAVFLWVTIRTSGMDSIVNHYHLRVLLPNRQGLSAYPTVVPNHFSSDMGVFMNNMNTSALYEKTAEIPIARGAAKTGVLMFLFENKYSSEIWRTDTTLELTFNDVKGHESAIRRTLKQENTEKGPMYFPGGPKMEVRPK